MTDSRGAETGPGDFSNPLFWIADLLSSRAPQHRALEAWQDGVKAVEKATKSQKRTLEQLPPSSPILEACSGSCACGLESPICKRALDDGVDKDGKPIPADILRRIRFTKWQIEINRMIAKAVQYDQAVAALDHWFHGCGEYYEIPADTADKFREEIEKRHMEEAKKRFRNGLRTTLAKEIDKNGKKEKLRFNMNWRSGGTTSFIQVTDSDLAYHGATGASKVTYECEKVHNNISRKRLETDKQLSDDAESIGVAYSCKVVDWNMWIEDNYDFTGRLIQNDRGEWSEAKGSKSTFFLIPTDAEMNELAQYGCGANYQRASSSWSVDESEWGEASQNVDYRSDREIQAAATLRREKERGEKGKEEFWKKYGVLPGTEPANQDDENADSD